MSLVKHFIFLFHCIGKKQINKSHGVTRREKRPGPRHAVYSLPDFDDLTFFGIFMFV